MELTVKAIEQSILFYSQIKSIAPPSKVASIYGSLWKANLGDLVTVAALSFLVWRSSSDGEIAGESGGFRFVGDGTAAFL